MIIVIITDLNWSFYNMCFSKRTTKSIKTKILSTTTEALLLVVYLCIYPYILFVVNDMQSDYNMRQDMLFVSISNPISNVILRSTSEIHLQYRPSLVRTRTPFLGSNLLLKMLSKSNGKMLTTNLCSEESMSLQKGC